MMCEKWECIVKGQIMYCTKSWVYTLKKSGIHYLLNCKGICIFFCKKYEHNECIEWTTLRVKKYGNLPNASCKSVNAAGYVYVYKNDIIL